MKFYETIRFKFTWNIHNFSNFAFNFRTKRIEKGFLLFKKLLKFLLSKDEDQSLANSKVKSEEPEESEVKEEIVEAEVKSEEPTVSQVKEETKEPELKSIKPKKRKVKDEIIDLEIDSDNK